MTEQEHIQAIRATWPENGFASPGLLAAVDAALEAHPLSPSLWCLRGDIIQLSEDAEDGLELSDALQSYERALELDSSWVEGYESIGHFFDAVLDEPNRARPYFERAAKLRSENG